MKLKFASTSGVATLADLGLFSALSYLTPWPKPAINVISSGVGMVINFFLQKRYIFELKRNAFLVFGMSLGISLGGIALSTMIIKFLIERGGFFNSFPIAAKLIATAIVFFYNFYLKRFSFEKKFV